MRRILLTIIIALFSPCAIAAVSDGKFADPCAGKLENAEPETLARATATDACAALRLAERYATGKGVMRDLKASFDLYTLAASSGNPAAQYALGSLYYNGLGIKQDIKTALDWFIKSASQNNPYAQMRLGAMYGAKDEEFYNEAKSLEYYKKAAAQGFTRARLSLGGVYYKKGEYSSALEQFRAVEAELPRKKAGNIDWSAAEADLGLYVCDAYRDNYSRTLMELAGQAQKQNRPDDVSAYILKATELGSKAMLVFAGDLYYRGEGVPQNYQTALSYYNQAADEGIAAAQTRIALMKFNGISVEKDTAAAMDLLVTAAAAGDTAAQMFAADIYFTGNQITHDYEKAFYYYKQAAKTDNAALFNQAFMTELGYGTKRDPAEALKLYETCSENGYRFARALLAYKYDQGLGVAKDPARGSGYGRRAAETAEPAGLPVVFSDRQGKPLLAAIYKLLADNGDYASANALGYLYEKGDYIEKNSTEAIKWYMLAADHGISEAALNLGNFHFADGNYKAALEWYGKAAAKGSIPAAHSAGWLHYSHPEGPASLQKAFLLFSSAAAAGYAEAQTMLGNMYMEGVGAPKNCALAENWYRKAAAADNPAALAGLGYLAAQGCGKTPKDFKAAARYYSRAAALGNPFAMLSLAAMHETGEGVAPDIHKALDYYTAAAELGDFAGAQGAALILAADRAGKPDYDRAYVYFSKAAQGRITESYFYLAVLCERGRGTERDFLESYKWYYACAKSGGARLKICSSKVMELEQKLSPGKIAEARRQAAPYLKTAGQPVRSR